VAWDGVAMAAYSSRRELDGVETLGCALRRRARIVVDDMLKLETSGVRGGHVACCRWIKPCGMRSWGSLCHF
jgi:hypothetical protein